MNHSQKKGGYTLIELLVVIAIIGVLASIIIISLNETRKKGNDAKIKAQLEQARNAAQIYHNSNDNYTPAGNNGNANSCSGPLGTMFVDAQSGMSRIIDPVISPYGNLECRHNATNGAFGQGATEYAVSAQLSSGQSWCVDFTGFSGKVASPPGNNDTTCN